MRGVILTSAARQFGSTAQIREVQQVFICAGLRIMCLEDVLHARTFLMWSTCKLCYVVLVHTHKVGMQMREFSSRPTIASVRLSKVHPHMTRESQRHKIRQGIQFKD